MSDNIIGYKFKTNILGQQVLYIKILTWDLCPATFDESPEYSYFKKASRQDAEAMLMRCEDDGGG